jgi:hypothetical protein
MSFRWFNEAALRSAASHVRRAPAGFAYGYVPDIIRPDRYDELATSFPDTATFALVDKQSGGGRKRFYVGPSYFAGRDRGCICAFHEYPVWRDVLEEAHSPELVSLLSAAFGARFNSVCDFGLTYGNAGCVQEAHIDGSARPGDPNDVRSVVATIVYFNTKPDPIGGTAVYLPDRSTILAQAPHLKNGMFFFRQHPAAWHGFPEMPAGTERHILSLSWSHEQAPISLRKSLLHSTTCKYRIRDVFRTFRSSIKKGR